MEEASSRATELVVLWTSGNREVALKMVFMYTLNSKLKEWWKEVTLIVWGPSSKLLSMDTDLQVSLSKMKEAGVRLMACKRCADMYGVSGDLERLGLEVKYMGEPLTQFLKTDGCRVITF
ncbi:MAG: DsrE family protein [archaeon]